MAELWAQYSAATERWTRAIVAASNPAAPYDSIPTRTWPLVRLDIALAAGVAYTLMCIYGFIRARAASAKAKAEGLVPVRRRPVPVFTMLANLPAHLAKVASDPLKLLLTLHNVVQVGLSAYMAVSVYMAAQRKGYGLVCNEYDPQDTEVSTVVWIFYVSKLYDFIDTIFIVARGSWGKLSFLHTYHHLSIFLTYWWVMVTSYTGDTWLPVMMNSIIHTIMYFYFLLTSLGATPQWDIIMTCMQMVQFILMMIQGYVIVDRSCPFPSGVAKFYVVYIGSMLVLFANFFVFKYVLGGGKGKAKAAAAAAEAAAVTDNAPPSSSKGKRKAKADGKSE